MGKVFDLWIGRFYSKLSRFLTNRRRLYLNNLLCSKMNRCGKSLNVEEPFYIQGEKFISIGDCFLAKPGLRIDCFQAFNDQQFSPRLSIGNNVLMNYSCHIGVINEVTIGNDVLFGSRVLVTDHAHGTFSERFANIPYIKRELVSKGPVHIEDNVWIGENVCILPGVTIGKGSIIGSNAVVTKDIPAYSVAVGIPAKVIKQIGFNDMTNLH